jgi:hypothetical protein
MPHYFKIYGLMRTGTNYISTTLQKNFVDTKVFMNVGGCKHCKIILIPDETNVLNSADAATRQRTSASATINLFATNTVKFIVMVKNPYMWIDSMCRHRRRPLGDHAFIVEQIKAWNTLYADYKQHIESGKAHLIKYEDLIENPDKVLGDVMTKFGLKRKFANRFHLESKHLLPNTDSGIGCCTNQVFNKMKYINPNIHKVLPKNVINAISSNIDSQLMGYYNYDIIDVS